MADGNLTLTDEQIRAAREEIERERESRSDFVSRRNELLETDAPDDVAYDLKKSKELGVPRVAIAGDRDRFRRQDEVEQQKAYRESAPRFSEWLSNPDNYAVARDDKENMGIFEKIASGFSKTPQAASASAKDVWRSTGSKMALTMSDESLSAAELMRKMELGNADRALERVGEKHGYNTEIFQYAARKRFNIYNGGGRFGQRLEDDREFQRDTLADLRKFAEQYQSEMPETNGLIEGGFVSAAASGTRMVPAMLAGVATRGSTAPAAIIGGQTALDSRTEGRLEGLSPGQADMYGLIQGGIELGTERFGLKALFGKGEKSLTKRFLETMLREQVGEQLATHSQDFVSWQYLNPEKTVTEYMTERPDAAAQTAISTFLLTGTMSGTVFGLEAGLSELDKRAKRAMLTDGEKAVTDMMDAADKSALRNRSPEKFQEALERIVDKTDAETMVVDLDGLAEALEQSGIDVREAAADFGATPEELQQAFDMGGEFNVKTAALLNSKLARENREALQDHIRLEGDALTPSQRRKEVEAIEVEMTAELGRMGEEIKDAVTREDMELQVREMITEQIGGTDVYSDGVVSVQARALEAMVSTLASRLDITPVEAYQQLAPRLRGVVAGEVREADVPAGGLEQMAGAGAAGADVEALSRAQSMAARGASRDDIWTDTGWYQGVDGKWRFEISDDKAMSTQGEWGFVREPDGSFFMNRPSVDGVLSDALNSSDLYENYPKLADTLTVVKEGESTGVRLPIAKEFAEILGRAPSDNVSKVSIDAKDDLRASLLHEGQHLIQNEEGFALGGSPQSVRIDSTLSDLVEARASEIFETQKNTFSDYTMGQAKQAAAEEIYERLAGEVEARAVERRMDLTPEERRARPPWLDYDVPEEDQILRFAEAEVETAKPEKTRRKLFGLFQQPTKRSPRGVFDPTRNEITLFEGANLSTLMHEAAHWYFDSLLRLEADGTAPAFVSKQLDEVFKWGGVARGTAIYDETGKPTEQGRELHETFAETFEAYLQDGKAPSAKLRDVFRSFKAWLTQLYRKLDPRARANLTPEIRQVFDRMMAVDDQITAATKQFEQTAEQMAQSLLDRGIITERQFKNAKKRLGDAREKAKEELMARLMDDVTRTEKQWWKTERERVKGEVAREFDRSPVGRAMAWLGEGVYKGDVPEGKIPQGEALMYQAREEGYEGDNMGEAAEWLRVKAKGLDMSTEARMERARAMGFDTETKLYHGTNKTFKQFDRGRQMDGMTWFSASKEQVISGQSGAAGTSNIIEAFTKRGKFAGWDDYDATPLQRLEDDGFIGLKLEDAGEPTTYAIFDPSNIRSVNAAFDPDYTDSANLLAQSGDVPADMYVAHNITAQGIREALDLGGMAMPSLAVTRTGAGFGSYGDITLIADKSLLNDGRIRTFDADIYSPRQPRATNLLDEKEAYKVLDELREATDGLGVRELDLSRFESDGVSELLYNESVAVAYAKQAGIFPKRLPKIKVEGVTEAAKRAASKMTEYTVKYDFVRDEKMIELGRQYFDEKLQSAKSDAVGRSIWGKFVDVDGTPNQDGMSVFYSQAYSARRAGGVDKHETVRIVREKIDRTKVQQAKFREYAEALAERISKGKGLWKGRTPTGRHKYTDYTLENVVASMKAKALRGGEGYNYGVGNLRAAAANELTSIEDMKASRNKIVSADDMKALKEESSDKMGELLEYLKPRYKYDASDFGYYSEASSALGEGPRGWSKVFNLDNDDRAKIRDFMSYLADMPTEYFEAKASRAMQFSEFSTAVMPRGTGRDVVDALKSQGVTVRYYNASDPSDRFRVIEGMKGLLFQSGGNPKGWGETAPPPDLAPMRLNLSDIREAFGEEAVRKLPYAVRKRAASSDDVNDMIVNVKSVRDTLKAKPPTSLFKFIRSKKVGGIKEGNHSGGDVRSIMDSDYSLFNNKNGRDLDYVREMAEEAGYITSETDEFGRTSIQDLLDALSKEASGTPVYSIQDADEANNYENALRWKEWFEDKGVDVFEPSKRTLRDQVEALVTSTADGAVDPDTAAQAFGFSSGEALLTAMSETGSRGKYLNAETDRRMAEEFGDPFNDGSLAEKARLYAENEVRVRQTEIELAALTEALGRNAASNRAKEMAKERLSEMTVKQVSAYNKFRDNEQRWSRAALEATEKGDMTNALIYKQRQLVNMHLYREGEKLSQKLDKVQRDLRKYETMKSRREKIDPEYMERIDELLSAYELRISKQGPKEQERRASVAEWVNSMTAEGREAEIAPEASLLAEAADRKTWQSLTVDEADYLKATIENLAHLGKRKSQLLSDRDKRLFNAVIDELVDTLEAAGPVGGKLTPAPSREKSHRPTAGERLSGGLRKSHAWLMRPEHQFRALDGKENGPIWNALFRSFADAADTESKMAHASAKAVRAAYNIYSSRQRYVMHNVGIELPELGKPIGSRWTKMDVISMALNWGVEYNRQALVEGYGWRPEQVEAVLDRVMTNKDWDFVEAIWQESGRYKKEAFALEKAMTGVEPKAVEGITFTLPSGRVIQGQYYHLEYDGRQIGKASNRQRVQDEREALSNRMRSFTKPQTRNGALKERVGSGGKPVKLNISVFERSVMETIHDIAYRKAIIDASRIVTNDRFRDAYQRTSGMEAYDQLMPWLEGIATEKTDQVQGMASILQTMRRNLPISYMGYKVGTAAIQWTGLLAGLPEVGPRYMAQGIAKSFAGNPLSVFGAWKAVSEKSEFMRDRPMGYDRDVREITSQMGEANLLADMRRNAFILISAMDVGVSTPLWMAGYDKALAGKVDGVERGNEDDAVAYADALIRRTQTAGRTQDLARVSRDSELWKSVTMIFGYFSNLYALTSQKVRAARSGQINPIEFAYFATILFVAIPILAELSAGRLLDEDEDESLASKSGDAVISNFAGMFPVIRDMVNYKLKPEYGYNMSPVASGMEDAAQTMNALIETAFQGEDFTEADTKRAVRAAGGIFGIPSSQLVITGDYIWDVMQGDEDPIEEPGRIFTEGMLRNTG